MILEKTINLIFQIYRYHKILLPKVNRIVVGSKYTGVEILPFAYAPIVGLAYTFPDTTTIENFQLLKEDSLIKLLKWSFEGPGLKKTIGIATLNAVSQHILQINNPYKKIKGDILDHLKINKEMSVTFIGSIKPMIKRISQITQNITIIEKIGEKVNEFKDFTLRSDINQLKLEQLSIDLLFCTGSSMINDTLEDILNLFRYKARKIVVIGPTASMIPDILFDSGVDIVGGMKIIDPSAVLKIIEEGRGTKAFKKYGKKYNLIKE